MKYRFIDLFAGAGGLSEGFIRAGYEAIAHIEMDHYACDSLKTRAAFHYLKENEKLDIYEDYLKNKKEKRMEVGYGTKFLNMSLTRLFKKL